MLLFTLQIFYSFSGIYIDLFFEVPRSKPSTDTVKWFDQTISLLWNDDEQGGGSFYVNRNKL